MTTFFNISTTIKRCSPLLRVQAEIEKILEEPDFILSIIDNTNASTNVIPDFKVNMLALSIWVNLTCIHCPRSRQREPPEYANPLRPIEFNFRTPF